MTYGSTETSLPNPRQPYEIRRIGGGQDMAVTLDEMKLDLRIDTDDEDMTVERLVRGMTDFFEHRTGWRLSPALFELLLDPVCAHITVERGPFRRLLGVWSWNATDRQWDTIDIAECTVLERGREFDVIFSDTAYATMRQCVGPFPYTVRLQFEAGFDSPEVTDTDVKGPAEDGMLLSLKALVALGFEQREAGQASGNWSGQDPSKDYLLSRYRKFW